MKISASFVPNESIAIRIVLDASDKTETGNKVVAQLQSKKFAFNSAKDCWERKEFNPEIKNDSFDFWLQQTQKLCNTFRGICTEEKQARVIDKDFVEIPPSSNPANVNVNQIVQQLQKQITLLSQEVDTLKKLNSAADKELRRLEQQLQRNQKQ
jgi:hypothetical protein